MIEGLCIEIKTDELAKLLIERADRCDKFAARTRAAQEKFLTTANVKLEEAERLLTSVDEEDFPGMIEDRRSIGLSNLKTGLRDFAARIENAEQRAAELRFTAAHLVKGETYRLSPHELNNEPLGGAFSSYGPVLRGRRQAP